MEGSKVTSVLGDEVLTFKTLLMVIRSHLSPNSER